LFNLKISEVLTDFDLIKQKLENLIMQRMKSVEPVFPFGNYFEDDNFKVLLDKVLEQ
jgi:hypothetical protein